MNRWLLTKPHWVLLSFPPKKTPFSSIVDCNVIPQTSRINRGCTEQWGKNGFLHFSNRFFCGFPSKRKKFDSFAFFITRIFSTFTHLSGFLEIILWGIEIESTKSISKEQWKGIYIILKEYCTGLELRLQSMSMEYWKESKDKTDQIHFDIEKNQKIKQIKYIPLLKRIKRKNRSNTFPHKVC